MAEDSVPNNFVSIEKRFPVAVVLFWILVSDVVNYAFFVIQRTTFSFLAFVIMLFYSTLSLAEFHGTVTATNDYIWRGYSKTDGGFALQANLDYEFSSGFYLGTTISNIDFGDDEFNDRANIEVIPYLGWTLNLAEDWRIDLQWSRYFYDGKIFGQHADYNEFYLFLHYRDLLTTSVSFSEDSYHQGHVTGEYGLTGRYPITDVIEFSSSIGYSQIKEILEYDYLHWNAGFTYSFKYVALDFRYMDAVEATAPVEMDWQYDPNVLEPTFDFSISIGF